ncbi:S41 family peptidase [soil metagenome]
MVDPASKEPKILKEEKSFLGKHARLKSGMLVVAAVYVVQFWFFQKIWCPPQELYHRVWKTTYENLFDQAAMKDWLAFEHKFDSKITNEADAVKYANKLLETLNDPFTKFLDAKQVAKKQDSHSGLYSGVGMIMNGKKKPVVVRMLIPGGPAARAGVKPGDQIIKIDDLDCLRVPPVQIGDYTRQHMGETIKLTVCRQGKMLMVAMVPSKMTLQSVKSRLIVSDFKKTNIAYVRLENFVHTDIVALVQKAFEQLKTAQGLILDVRGNGGGSVDSCLAIASMMLDTGDLVAMKSRTGTGAGARIGSNGGALDYQTVRYRLEPNAMKVLNEEPGKDVKEESRSRLQNIWQTKPIVVLMDDSSASASEMLAAALRDNNRAILIGVRSYGKGVAQIYYDMPLSTCLSLTAGRYYTPNGKWLGDGREPLESTNGDGKTSGSDQKPNVDHGTIIDRGIAPDIEVKSAENLDYGAANDNQLTEAVKFLDEKIAATK